MKELLGISYAKVRHYEHEFFPFMFRENLDKSLIALQVLLHQDLLYQKKELYKCRIIFHLLK